MDEMTSEGKFKEEIGEDHTGWSCRTNGRRKTGKESSCPESRGEMEAKKTGIATGIAFKVT